MILIIAVTLLFANFCFCKTVEVTLPSGKILGKIKTTESGTQYYAFRQIPYAAPPIGKLRFKAPQPVENWNGTLNATYLHVSCHQLERNATTDSEDCLFINVFTPELPTDGNVSHPVMFFIHGGAFSHGSSMQLPPDLFMDYGIVLVIINYRLGPFGFLSTQDNVIPGNNGLKDQKFALEWTYQNIHLFGGNNQMITLFGGSAGAASVSYQLLNQQSKNLIKGVILESGTFLCPWSYQRDARNIAFSTAAVLDEKFNKSNDSQELLEFLQSVDANDLNEAGNLFLKTVKHPWYYDISQGNIYSPVIEVKNSDAFLTKRMFGLLKEGNIWAVPTMIGFNSEESLLFNSNKETFQTVVEKFDSDLDMIVPNDMQILDCDEHYQMATKIRDMYTNGDSFTNHTGAAIRYSSDTSFTRPIIKYAEMFSTLADTFFYQFSYDGTLGNISVHYDGAESVGHTEERKYLFCDKNYWDFDNLPESDKIASKRLIQMWTDFAKHQNPTPKSLDILQNITWPKFTADNQFEYLDINEDLKIRKHPKNETYTKWVELYDSLDFNDFDTY